MAQRISRAKATIRAAPEPFANRGIPKLCVQCVSKVAKPSTGANQWRNG